MTGWKLSLIQVANKELIYWSVSSLLGGRGLDKGSGLRYIGILARCEFHFIREHDNLVKHSSNNKFIIL